MDLTTEKRKMILDIIEVRLDNVKDVTKRSRLAFLITTIASCAIIMTIWNVYFSTSRNVALVHTSMENQKVLTEAPNSSTLPLPEHNRRELIKEWIKNVNVSINLLGIDIHINDFPLIGSLSLFVISFWLFFTIRRENRAIVSLLRDVKNDLEFTEENKQKGNDRWDIANLAYHGVANSLIFFTTQTNDSPLSDKDIFGGMQDKLNGFLDRFITWLTKLIRILVVIVFFFPALTIWFIIWADDYSTYNIASPFWDGNKPPAQYMDIQQPHGLAYFQQIFIENNVGIIAGILTFFICIACVIFQLRTSKALKQFEEALDGKRPWNSPIVSEETKKEDSEN